MIVLVSLIVMQRELLVHVYIRESVDSIHTYSTVCREGTIPEVFDGDAALCVFEYVQQYPGPVAAITQLPQVRERLLWRPNHHLHLQGGGDSTRKE